MRLRLLLSLTGLFFSSIQAIQAQVQAPASGGGVSPIGVTATTLELSFGSTGADAGQGRVVAVAMAPNQVPVPMQIADNTFYTASTAYGQGTAVSSGFAVYNGTGHTVKVTGLRPATSYYVVTAEYNTDGTSIAYNTRSSRMMLSTPAASAAAAPLPVELTSFTGSVDAAGFATLRWTTASELASDYFALERSADGVAFAEAGRVPAAGSSTQALDYRWPDPQRLSQPTYYRLRQADHDGTLHYSATVLLTPPPALARRIEVYPVPSAGQVVQVLLQGYESCPVGLRLTNALGQVVLDQTLVPTTAQASLPVAASSTLAEGTYVLTLTGSGVPTQKRIVISR